MIELEPYDGPGRVIRYEGPAERFDIGNGYRLSWSVGPDGEPWPMLDDVREQGEAFIPYKPQHFWRIAPHELDGALPEYYRPRDREER